MRISISGTSNIGKTDFTKKFLNKYPNYSTPDTTYKHVIEAIHQKNTKDDRDTSSKDIQWNILNYMIDTMQKYNRDDDVLFYGCPLDNIIYSLYIMEKAGDVADIDSKFIDMCVPLIRESMSYLDIVFLLPFTKADKTERKLTEQDKEIHHLYDALHQQYLTGSCQFLPKDDQLAIIQIFGNTQQRLQMIGMYIDDDGNVINDTSISDIIDPDMVSLQEQVSKD